MTIKEITDKTALVSEKYSKEFGVSCTSEWFLLKLQEELGEMTQAYLMLTNQTRRKAASEQEGKEALAKEIADVFAYTLLFAREMNIDIEEAIAKKYFVYLE